MAGFCKSGSRPRPLTGGSVIKKASKGLASRTMRIRKKTCIVPNDAITVGKMSRFCSRFCQMTMPVTTASVVAQNMSEPAWPPQKEAIR